MNYNEKLGFAGERVVKGWAQSLGHKVILSEDRYDEKKDMTIDGVATEVKTQQPYAVCQFKSGIEPAVTLPFVNTLGFEYSNQLPKCLSVDRLLFLTIPGAYWPGPMQILEIEKHNRSNYELVKNKNGSITIAYKFQYTTLLKSFSMKETTDIMGKFFWQTA